METTFSYNTSVYDGVASGDVGVLTAMFTAIWAFVAAYSFVVLAVSALVIVAMWMVFKKAGKPGWAAIVPVYNVIVLFQISGISPWLILLNLVPILGTIAFGIISIVGCFKLAKAFGKDTGYGFGIWLLPAIFYPILGFGKAEYIGVEGNNSGNFERPVQQSQPVSYAAPTDPTASQEEPKI